MSDPAPRIKKIAEWNDAGFRWRMPGQDRGDDRRPQIDAENHHHSELWMDQPARGKGGQQDDGGNAGMKQPCHEGCEQIGRDRVARQIVDDDRQKLALPQRLGSLPSHFQRHDEKADTDQNASDLPPVTTLGGHEDAGADDKAERYQKREIVAQDLDDEGGAKLTAAHGHEACDAADKT